MTTRLSAICAANIVANDVAGIIAEYAAARDPLEQLDCVLAEAPVGGIVIETCTYNADETDFRERHKLTMITIVPRETSSARDVRVIVEHEDDNEFEFTGINVTKDMLVRMILRGGLSARLKPYTYISHGDPEEILLDLMKRY